MLISEPLLEVTRDFLRANLNNIYLPDRSIRLTDEERVPPYAGQEFINLYALSCENLTDPIFPYRQESYGLKIGITRRLSGSPVDSSAESIYTVDENLVHQAKIAMTQRAFDIVNLIDGKWAIPALIRQLSYLSGYSFCILSTLNYLSSSEGVREVFAEHFYGEDDNENPQGLFLELNFGEMHVYFDKI